MLCEGRPRHPQKQGWLSLAPGLCNGFLSWEFSVRMLRSRVLPVLKWSVEICRQDHLLLLAQHYGTPLCHQDSSVTTRICSKPCLHFIYNYALICNCCGIQQHLLSSTGDADAEVKKLMGESAQLSSSQQEAEAHLQHSKEAIQELQAALRNAQVRIALNGMLY